MKRTIGTFILGIVLVIGLSSFQGSEKIDLRSNWTSLGTKKINFRLDKDVLPVGIRDGRFTKLKLVVTGGSVNMHKMIVHYGNGTQQNIALRHHFSKKSTSRLIDLKGNKRIIRKITFVYDTKNISARKAKVHVFGKR